MCKHKISYGTVSEADGAYDPLDGSTVVDISCELCGASGSIRIMPADVNWDDDREAEEENAYDYRDEQEAERFADDKYHAAMIAK